MELTDVVIHSVKDTEKLHLFLKNIFPPNKFLLYEINKNELLNKSWYNSFRILVINCPDLKLYDKTLCKLINELIYDQKQIILISDNFSVNMSNNNTENIKMESFNDTVIVQNGNKTCLILFKNIEDIFKNYSVILQLWSLSKYSINQIKYHHSDIFAISENQDSLTNYLQSLKFSSLSENAMKNFQYNSLEFKVNFSQEKNSISGTSFNLLSYVNNKNSDFKEIISFKNEDYFSSLNTKYLGKIILFSEILSSSFDLMEKFVQMGNFHPINIISYVQNQGKGRGTNKWISPIGCAMFTCLIPISLHSNLGNSISLIQHIMAVSIVEAINFLCWIDKEALKIKWPNDIYWYKHGKVSGMILKAVTQANHVYCSIGTGINVHNNEPTVCIYDMIKAHINNNASVKVNYPSMEQVIAHVMNRFESNICSIQSTNNGIENFKNTYYKYWMHKDQNVTVNNDEGSIPGKIIGIDNFGFLQMVPNDTSKPIVTLHPDGNTFDMMHNLIMPK